VGKIYQAMKQAEKDRCLQKEQTLEQDSVSIPLKPASPPQSKLKRAPSVVRTKPAGPKGFYLDNEVAMTTLYQNIESRLSHNRKRIIQFIAAQSGEGTTTVAVNFARFADSRLGKKVVLLEGDLAHSGLVFSPNHRISLTEAVQHGDRAIKFIDALKDNDVTIICAAPDENQLLHFLQSEEGPEVWAGLKTIFDLIVINSPPISASAVGLAFCSHADGVILVLEAERTREPVAEHAKELIEKSGGNILGVVFNKRRYYIPKSIYKRL
jgi:protein-tyrosine kinase